LVKKGDELIVVESTELGQAQSEYLQKRTELVVTLAAVEPATQAHDRARKLYDSSQGIALGEVQKRQAEMRSAEGTALAAKAGSVAAMNKLLLLGMTRSEVKQLEETETLTPTLSVRSPIAGQVIERHATLGELVAPDKEQLLVIADMTSVWVLADVPEARLPQITAGSNASVQIDAIPAQRFEGKVAQIAPALNPDTRAGRVRIDVANTSGVLRPGMFATVQLSVGANSDVAVLAVPDDSIQTVEGAPAVFVPVEGEENTFAKRAVTPGQPVAGMVPIVSGLKEGESIVTAGSFILKAELGKSEAAHEH
jgi:cobalt-zinc-cadmium efflux system membrane fusion protein